MNMAEVKNSEKTLLSSLNIGSEKTIVNKQKIVTKEIDKFIKSLEDVSSKP